MTTLSTIQGNLNEKDSQRSTRIFDRSLDWIINVLEAFFGTRVGDAVHDNPAEAYLFLNPSCCGAVIDTKLWDLLTERKAQPETEEATNV